MSRFVLALAALSLGACASSGTSTTAAPAPMAAPSTARAAAPAKPAPVNPVGQFEFSTELNGSPMKGLMKIAGTAGNYSGSMTSDITPELPISTVTADGQTVKIGMDTPNGAATITLLFTGDTFTGNWELGGASGPLTGKRIK